MRQSFGQSLFLPGQGGSHKIERTEKSIREHPDGNQVGYACQSTGLYG